MLHEFLKKEGIEATETNIQKLCTLHKLKTPEDLMYQIGQKVFTLGDLDKNELKEKSTPTNWKKYIDLHLEEEANPSLRIMHLPKKNLL